jgi:hypothetical protein
MADKAELAAAVLREAVTEEENSAKGSTEGAAAALARASRPAPWGLERPAAAAPEIVERAWDAAFEETWLLQRARTDHALANAALAALADAHRASREAICAEKRALSQIGLDADGAGRSLQALRGAAARGAKAHLDDLEKVRKRVHDAEDKVEAAELKERQAAKHQRREPNDPGAAERVSAAGQALRREKRALQQLLSEQRALVARLLTLRAEHFPEIALSLSGDVLGVMQLDPDVARLQVPGRVFAQYTDAEPVSQTPASRHDVWKATFDGQVTASCGPLMRCICFSC